MAALCKVVEGGNKCNTVQLSCGVEIQAQAPAKGETTARKSTPTPEVFREIKALRSHERAPQ
jgi:hypothetical protein